MSASKYECTGCKKKFMYQSALERHKAKFHADDVDASPPAKVQYIAAAIKSVCCGAVFPNVEQYVDHIIRFQSELLASWYLSGGEDLVEAILLSQKRTIAVGSTYMCELCCTRFLDLPSLHHHVALHDSADGFQKKAQASKRANDDKISIVAKMSRCNVCTGIFHTPKELDDHRHEKKHFDGSDTQKQPQGPIDCCETGTTCHNRNHANNSVDQLAAHLNENHAKTANTMHETADSECSRRTTAINQAGSSKLPRPYLCEKCGKTYTQSGHLFQHLRFHNGVRPFACPMYPCDRSFTIRSDLNDHIRKCHTGERPYKCDVCDKRFLTRSVYYQHRLIHVGERRYACPYCDKRFYRADVLKSHRRIHTGEKPYACHVCARKFRQRGDRARHARLKHMEMR